MDTEARSRRNLEEARTERTCPEGYKDSRYYRSNKPAISLPQSDTNFPKLKCEIPKFDFNNNLERTSKEDLKNDSKKN